ncbi:SDR family oxidoreductase [Acinetobacter baumannii]|uniref:AciE n=1 Tax=Acinetobacter baumannii TaxID=470 RepID=A0A222UR32_ACIBA|nr:SDR family oxidoreductase [Acinetobacter baumannii]ASR24079.1 AciE [Acinetobacter baumannii]MDW5369286.1 SDR family oxidoreductase [Acinetobacter baumannii]MDW5384498.1 SDR family oxidoreductase [Acinetobacter baumannii]MDW5412974.1 SDR family oxidoreductase [Acinetobacter baumannii]MDW5456064.1 SDR family oxidoreductase [Acinetobacter baumannii]
MTSLKTLFDLTGKTALVTGGAGLLGSQIADALAEQGANLIIASRSSEKCIAKAKQLRDDFPNIKVEICPLDLVDTKSIQECIEYSENVFGTLDILVTCAWSGRKNSWETINDEDWNYDIEVCLNGVYRLIKASTQALRKSKGVILNIGSMYGHVAPDYRLYEGVPQANPPSYGAAKAGIIQLTKYLGSFLAKDGIRVNCISPGPFPFEHIINEFPEFKQRLCDKNPMQRLGKAHEIKGAAIFLCSDASSYVTGQNLCVDGGWTIW